MNVLHVEDDKKWFERSVLPELQQFCHSVHHCENYDEAVSIIGKNHIDYVILDQSIPKNTSSNTPDTANGILLADYIRINYPGTPILILTGQNQESMVEKYVEDQEQIVFWNGKPQGLVKSRPKRRLNEALNLIKAAKEELDNVESIELDISRSVELDRNQKRVIKLFGKQHGATAAKVSVLTSGLSSSSVYRVTLLDSQKNEIHFALAKIDNKDKVDIEIFNFKTYINKLPVGSFPNLLGQYSAGCGDTKGVFYRFANEYDSDYFEELIRDQKIALNTLKKVVPLFNIWETTKQGKKTSIKDIRLQLCSDEKFKKLEVLHAKFDITQFENHSCQFFFCIQHADLHGKNILTSSKSNPIIIDYGDIAEAPSLLDIVTLELSPFFHIALKGKIEYSNQLFDVWFEDEEYFALYPFQEIAKYLRQMKAKKAFLNKDYVATVYAYAVRQLTFEDTNHDIALQIIDSAIKEFNSL
jgi:response regulator of citrate/malate metabolism